MAATASASKVTSAAAQFSSRCAIDPVPGIGSITGERCSSQASATWEGSTPSRAACCGNDATLREQLPVAEGKPRDEADVVHGAVGEQLLALAQPRVIEVLHADDVEGLLRCLQVIDIDLRQPDVADEPLVDHLGDHAELLIGGHLRVDAMQLPQVDAVDTEATQRHQHALAQVFGATDRLPLIRARAGSGRPWWR